MKMYFVIGSSMWLLFAVMAGAEDYKPGAIELAPKQKIECDWSKMKASEYSECQKKAEYYEEQTPKERREQNVAARKQIRAQNAVSIEDGAGPAARKARRAGRRR